MSVINFCNALTSYPTEYNIDITVRNVAQLFECPDWIVNCRNQLSHPTSKPPTQELLSEAIAFALEWLNRFFFQKAISGQFNFSSQTDNKSTTTNNNNNKKSPLPTSSTNQQPSLSLSSPSISDEQIKRQTSLLLFTACPNKRSIFKREIQQYITLNPHEYINLFCQILVFDVPNHYYNHNCQSFTLPKLLLRRSSRIFTMIMSALSADQMLILLLNQLLNQIVRAQLMCHVNIEDNFSEFDYNQKALYIGLCWLWAIVDAVTIPLAYSNHISNSNSSSKCNNDTMEVQQQKTMFQKCFDLFGDLSILKRRHTFTWVRMFYRICKLKLNQNSGRLVRQFYYLIDPEVISEEKFNMIVDLIDCTMSDNGSNNNKVNKESGNTAIINNNKLKMKTLDDLIKEVNYLVFVFLF